MKKVLSLFLCLAITLSFSAPVSARMLKSRDEAASSSQGSTSKKESTAKKDTVKDSSAVKKDSNATSSSALTPVQYVSRIEAIRMTVTGDLANFLDVMFSPTTSEADLMKEMNKITASMAKAISDMSELKAPKEFAKTSTLFKTAAKKATTWNRLIKQALKTNKDSDMQKALDATQAVTDALEAAFAEYDRACAKM